MVPINVDISRVTACGTKVPLKCTNWQSKITERNY